MALMMDFNTTWRPCDGGKVGDRGCDGGLSGVGDGA